MANRKYEVVDILLSTLRDLPNQPPSRTDRNMDILADSMSRVGQLTLLLVAEVKGLYYTADGHCRRRAAEMLNWPTLRCHVVPCESMAKAEELFLEANGPSRAMTPAEYFWTWAKAATPALYLRRLAEIKKDTAAAIEEFIDVFEVSGARQLAQEFPGVSPHIIWLVEEAHQLLIASLRNESWQLRPLVRWAMAHKVHTSLGRLMRDGRAYPSVKAKRIARAFKKDGDLL